MKNAIIKALVNAGGGIGYMALRNAVIGDNGMLNKKFVITWQAMLDDGEIQTPDQGNSFVLPDNWQIDKPVSRETLPQYQHMTLESALQVAEDLRKQGCISKTAQALIFLADSLEIIRNQAIIDHITKG